MNKHVTSGPVSPALQTNDQPFLIPVLNKKQRLVFYSLTAIFLTSVSIFLVWWSNPAHIVSWGKFIINTVLLLWIILLPLYYFFFVARMRKPNPSLHIPPDWRVAMITTRAPSEPFSIVRATLTAMLSQKYPHDTWLADEDPDDEIIAWCKLHGVKLITRKGVADYHRDIWPRRTRCKEGNLAYFYDHYGYDGYDFVVQLDADHVPTAGYLEEMIRPFVNDSIGYVSAPSICDSNSDISWSAKGRLYSEALMHGTLQAGYTNDFAPLCIGSHYAVRTRALKEIGGLGPELAEDHSTTLMMNGFGWRGVHAYDAIAHGEGPPGIAECVTQEFQWSRSLIILLLTELPKYWKKLPLRMKLQFLFSELWYPVFGLMFVVGSIMPIMAVISGKPWMAVSFVDFMKYSIPTNLSILGVVWYLKQQGLFRPANAPIFSWEVMLFQMLRWPWVIYGTAMGIFVVITRKTPGFKVTPKGGIGNALLTWSLLYPYIAVILITSIPGILVREDNSAAGYHFFMIISTTIYTILVFMMLVLHRLETARIRKRNNDYENIPTK
jgi:cellulose synthase (UDP-forming)